MLSYTNSNNIFLFMKKKSLTPFSLFPIRGVESKIYVHPALAIRIQYTEKNPHEKKPAFRSAFFNPRVLISFAVCAIGALLALLAFALYPGGTARAEATPTLSHSKSNTRSIDRARATERAGQRQSPPRGR